MLKCKIFPEVDLMFKLKIVLPHFTCYSGKWYSAIVHPWLLYDITVWRSAYTS